MSLLVLRVRLQLRVRLRFGPLLLRLTEGHCTTEAILEMLELCDRLAALDSTDACHSLQPLNVHGRQGQNPAKRRLHSML